MITERTLRKWRRLALYELDNKANTTQIYSSTAPTLAKAYIQDQQKILQMTQELLDHHLLKDTTNK